MLTKVLHTPNILRFGRRTMGANLSDSFDEEFFTQFTLSEKVRHPIEMCVNRTVHHLGRIEIDVEELPAVECCKRIVPFIKTNSRGLQAT